MCEILEKQAPKLVALLTRYMTTRQEKREKWAKFKAENNETLCEILGIDSRLNQRAGSLIDFDVDDEKRLVLLNYTQSAHNLLHTIPGGWTPFLCAIRGTVYTYQTPGEIEGITLVSRGFEKFFNLDEIPETSLDRLVRDVADMEIFCVSKEDGHMMEFFLHQGELCTTTRGRLGSPSAGWALKMMTLSDFYAAKEIVSRRGKELMTLVCEFVDPASKVIVDYGNVSQLFLLEAYDSHGEVVGHKVLEEIAEGMPELFKLPQSRSMTLQQLIAEVSDRSVKNQEGWVAQIPSEGGGFRRVKFKYIDYIGKMVSGKLSYRYLMNCMKNNRLDKMLFTLPETDRQEAYDMVQKVKAVTEEAKYGIGHRHLYQLYIPSEGSVENFRNICREYYKSVSLA